MTKAQQAAVSNYLISLRDPSALRDDDAIAGLQTRIDQTERDTALGMGGIQSAG